MPERRTVDSRPPKPPELVEYAAEFTGIDAAKFYRCPLCGRSGQDKKLMTVHVREPHGGEA